MAKVAKTFKLEAEQWAAFEELAKASGKTLTATLADLIEGQGSQAEGSKLEEAVSGTVEALRGQLAAKDAQLEAKDRQLAVKDQQLSDLTASLKEVSKSLSTAQENTKNAQTLHAVEVMPELVGAEGKPEKRTFRDRWQAFWA